MNIAKGFREYELLDESITLTVEQETKLLTQFLQYLGTKANKDDIEKELVKILNLLNERGRFHLQLVDRKDQKNRDLAIAYGYYSAYENTIYLVLDKSNFESKWLGLITDFNS